MSISKDKVNQINKRTQFFVRHFRDLAYGMMLDVMANANSLKYVRAGAFERLEKAYDAYEKGKSADVVSKIARGQKA
jgi:hypothetical protein